MSLKSLSLEAILLLIAQVSNHTCSVVHTLFLLFGAPFNYIIYIIMCKVYVLKFILFNSQCY